MLSDYPEIIENGLIEYITFENNFNGIKKILVGIINISTTYTVICSDDDFITLEGISNSVKYLENNPDFSAAHGNYISFWLENNIEKSFQWKPCYQTYDSIISDDGSKRFLEHFVNYKIPTFSAVHKTEHLKHIISETLIFSNDYRFGELLPSLITLIYGKMKRLDVFYSARRFDPNSAGRVLPSFMNYIAEDTFDKKYSTFKKCLSKHLIESTNCSNKDASKTIDKGMYGHLKLHYNRNYNFVKLKYKLKRIAKRTILFNTVLKVLTHIYKRIKFVRKSETIKITSNNSKNEIAYLDLEKNIDFQKIREIVIDHNF
jgi:glycosyltransferase domain-containing protein